MSAPLLTSFEVLNSKVLNVSKHRFWFVTSSLFALEYIDSCDILNDTRALFFFFFYRRHTYTACTNCFSLSLKLLNTYVLTYKHFERQYRQSPVSKVLRNGNWGSPVRLLDLRRSFQGFLWRFCAAVAPLSSWVVCGLGLCCCLCHFCQERVVPFFCQFPPGGNVKRA